MDEDEQKSTGSCAKDYGVEKQFLHIAHKAVEENSDEWHRLYDKYTRRGMDEDDAHDQANEKTEENTVQSFLRIYKDTIVNMLLLKKSKLHRCIFDMANTVHKYGISPKVAAKEAIKKFKTSLDVEELIEVQRKEYGEEPPSDIYDESTDESSHTEEDETDSDEGDNTDTADDTY